MPLSIGDPAPIFHAKSNTNPNYAFDTAAGRNIVLSFNILPEKHSKLLESLSHIKFFNDEHSCLFIVSKNNNEEHLPLRIPGIRAFHDEAQNIHNLYGIKEYNNKIISFIISPRLQIAKIIKSNAISHAEDIEKTLKDMGDINLSPLLSHAPILIIPNVFEPEFCEFLINGYKKYGGRVSGFMRDVDGKTIEIQDKNHKVRRDWNIEETHLNIIKNIQNKFLKRVIPEIKKAYQFEVSRMERYLVSCYEAEEGGHFRPHRDNTTKGTAHRRFAVSLNLNAENYGGGNLRFPEFGMQTYKPPTGGCCIFSCSLLHEATKVTSGTRYAFLPFLYDESARKIREENLKFLSIEEN